MGTTSLIKKLFVDQGLYLNDHQLEQFDTYRHELKEWNKRTNLTSLTDDADIAYKHFIDSLLIIRYYKIDDGVRIADVGTGAGFPGIPLKIYSQNIQLTLFESIGKKARFLEHVVAKLGLENVKIVGDRVENSTRTPEYREQFNLVVARAVAKLPILAEYCLPLVSLGGKFVAYKGSKIELELEEAKFAIEILGGMIYKIEHARLSLEKEDLIAERSLIFIDKIKNTPENYPRRPGIPEKKPL